MIGEPVSRALRAKVAPVDRPGGCMKDLVRLVGKAALAARCLGHQKVIMKR